MVLAATRAAAAAQAWMVWLMCVVVTYEVDSWMKRGASRPAVAGNVYGYWYSFVIGSLVKTLNRATNHGVLLNTAHTPPVVATPVLHATNDH